MAKRKFETREEYVLFLQELERKERRGIESDFSLILYLLFQLAIYLVLLIPRVVGFVIFSILLQKKAAKHQFKQISLFLPALLSQISKWFFQAKITSTLIIFLIIAYGFQILFLNSDLTVLQQYMTHPDHLTSGNYLSLFTSIFLHGSLLHLFSNAVALLLFGRIVERHFKSAMLWVFLASGIIANIISHVISLLTGDLFFSLGASGAIAGLVIFAILLEPLALTTLLIIPLPIFIIGWLLVFLDISGLTNPSQVNHIAHLGGYSALLILYFFLNVRKQKKLISGLIINVLALIALFLIFQFVPLPSTELIR